MSLAFERGVHTAPASLPGGAWRVEIRTVAGPAFKVTDRLYLPEGC